MLFLRFSVITMCHATGTQGPRSISSQHPPVMPVVRTDVSLGRSVVTTEGTKRINFRSLSLIWCQNVLATSGVVHPESPQWSVLAGAETDVSEWLLRILIETTFLDAKAGLPEDMSEDFR